MCWSWVADQSVQTWLVSHCWFLPEVRTADSSWCSEETIQDLKLSALLSKSRREKLEESRQLNNTQKYTPLTTLTLLTLLTVGYNQCWKSIQQSYWSKSVKVLNSFTELQAVSSCAATHRLWCETSHWDVRAPTWGSDWSHRFSSGSSHPPPGSSWDRQ